MKNLKIIILIFVTIGCFGFSSNTSAQAPDPTPTEYVLLEPLPLGPNNTEVQSVTTAEYIPGLFRLIIGIAGVLAVVMIIWGGIKYMSTDAFSGKNEAKGIIENALWGLLLAMAAWLIVYTINPNLVTLDLNIPAQNIGPATLPPGSAPPAGSPGSVCIGCEVVSVPHKSAPNGCAAPGPCRIDPLLNSRLVSLNNSLSNRPAPQRSLSLEVTESYPPTRAHVASCHYNGTCVDANFADRSAASNSQNIKSFIEAASSSNLRAVYEVSTESRAAQIRTQAGLSNSQVIVVPGITGEHFSVYGN